MLREQREMVITDMYVTEGKDGHAKKQREKSRRRHKNNVELWKNGVNYDDGKSERDMTDRKKKSGRYTKNVKNWKKKDDENKTKHEPTATVGGVSCPVTMYRTRSDMNFDTKTGEYDDDTEDAYVTDGNRQMIYINRREIERDPYAAINVLKHEMGHSKYNAERSALYSDLKKRLDKIDKELDSDKETNMKDIAKELSNIQRELSKMNNTTFTKYAKKERRKNRKKLNDHDEKETEMYADAFARKHQQNEKETERSRKRQIKSIDDLANRYNGKKHPNKKSKKKFDKIIDREKTSIETRFDIAERLKDKV